MSRFRDHLLIHSSSEFTYFEINQRSFTNKTIKCKDMPTNTLKFYPRNVTNEKNPYSAHISFTKFDTSE